MSNKILKQLKNFNGNCEELLKLLDNETDWCKYGTLRMTDHSLMLVTGGWSENEEAIGALTKSLFWTLHFAGVLRGGVYYFVNGRGRDYKAKISDVLIDIARDKRLQEQLNECSEAEIDFFTNDKKNKERAEKIIVLWEEHKNIRSGYWHSPHTDLANRRIREFKEYLETGKIPISCYKIEREKTNV